MLLISVADGLASYVLLEVHEPQAAVRLLDLHLANLFGDAVEGQAPAGSERGAGAPRAVGG
ncbi:hypothetical protein [Streptomyces sirii]|uniref:hypothetical protein n=1 Tax=Streptomyces sirii TaxID=3127701 RepID=UPI003D367D87